jgi:hypothetical protein
VEGVHDRRHPRPPRGNPTECTALRGVRVHATRALAGKDPDQGPQRPQVVSGADLATKPGHPVERDPGQVAVLHFAVLHRAGGDRHLGVPGQRRHEVGGAADVQPTDDVQDAPEAHLRWSATTERMMPSRSTLGANSIRSRARAMSGTRRCMSSNPSSYASSYGT